MEIHHPQHYDPAHKEKLWKHYVLDFFMLFLAVSAGFFAENFRTNLVEANEAKQYIQSFYEDLKADTARISFNMNFDEKKIEGLSDITNCYDTVSKNLKSTSCMISLIKSSTINRPFQWTDRTLKQLDNAGGFRLLDKDDADSIIKYESGFNLFQDFQSTIFQEAQNNVRSTYNLLVDFKANAQMLRMSSGEGLLTFHDDVTAPLLFSDDKILLNEYFNELYLYYRVTIAQHRQLTDLKKNQIRLIEFFRNKYHFE